MLHRDCQSVLKGGTVWVVRWYSTGGQVVPYGWYGVRGTGYGRYGGRVRVVRWYGTGGTPCTCCIMLCQLV